MSRNLYTKCLQVQLYEVLKFKQEMFASTIVCVKTTSFRAMKGVPVSGPNLMDIYLDYDLHMETNHQILFFFFTSKHAIAS